MATHKVDLALIDWQRPEMNGEELLKKIQQKQINNDVPVIVMSCQKPFCCKAEGFFAFTMVLRTADTLIEQARFTNIRLSLDLLDKLL